VAFRCHHSSCAGYGWQQLRDRYDGVRISALEMLTKNVRTARAARKESHGH
jgi:hypothetical protein